MTGENVWRSIIGKQFAELLGTVHEQIHKSDNNHYKSWNIFLLLNLLKWLSEITFTHYGF